MKEESKKQFTEEINWKRVRVHLDKQGIKDLNFLKEKLRLHGESANIRESIRLAVSFIGIREKEIEEIKNRINDLKIKEFELYGN
jgi:hypothetical protein